MAGFDLSGLSVALVMPHRDEDDIKVSTMSSVIGTMHLLSEYGIRYIVQQPIGGLLLGARSLSVKRFLESAMSRMFLLDSDMVWKPEDFMRVLAYSTRYDVIGACYVRKSDKPFFFVNFGDRSVIADDLGCLQPDNMGLGFTCIQRHVIEKLSAKARMKKFAHNEEPLPGVFRFGERHCTEYDEFSGEDTEFFADIGKLGFDIKMDPSIELGHIGWKQYRARFSDFLTRSAEAAE